MWACNQLEPAETQGTRIQISGISGRKMGTEDYRTIEIRDNQGRQQTNIGMYRDGSSGICQEQRPPKSQLRRPRRGRAAAMAAGNRAATNAFALVIQSSELLQTGQWLKWEWLKHVKPSLRQKKKISGVLSRGTPCWRQDFFRNPAFKPSKCGPSLLRIASILTPVARMCVLALTALVPQHPAHSWQSIQLPIAKRDVAWQTPPNWMSTGVDQAEMIHSYIL